MTVVQNDVLRADSLMVFDSTNQQVNSFQYIRQTATPTSDALALADLKQMLEALYLLVQSFISVLVVFDKVRGFNLTQSLSLGDINYTAVLGGLDAGEAVPPGVSPVVNYGTAVPRVTLRKFGPTYTETQNLVDGTLGSPLLVAYAAMAALMLAPQVAVGGTYQYGFLSPKTLGFVIPTSAVIGNTPGYQRRRKQGRGS